MKYAIRARLALLANVSYSICIVLLLNFCVSSGHRELLFKTLYEPLVLQLDRLNRIKNFRVNSLLQISGWSFALFFNWWLTDEFFLCWALVPFDLLDLFTSTWWLFVGLSVIEGTQRFVVDGFTDFNIILLNLIELRFPRCHPIFNQVLLFLILANFCEIVLSSCQELLLVWRFILRLLHCVPPYFIDIVLMCAWIRQFVVRGFSFFEECCALDRICFCYALLSFQYLAWAIVKSISHWLFLSEFLVCTLDCLFWPSF